MNGGFSKSEIGFFRSSLMATAVVSCMDDSRVIASHNAH